MPVKDKGWYINNGYKRFSAGQYRDKYEHQVIIEQLLQETPKQVRELLPDPFEIHHLDFNKQHNCTYNFLLLDNIFHSCLTASNRRRCPYTGRFLSLDAYNRRMEGIGQG